MSSKEQIKSITSIIEKIGGKGFNKFNSDRTTSGSLLTYSEVKVTDKQLQEINAKIEPLRGRAFINGSNLEVRVYYPVD